MKKVILVIAMCFFLNGISWAQESVSEDIVGTTSEIESASEVEEATIEITPEMRQLLVAGNCAFLDGNGYLDLFFKALDESTVTDKQRYDAVKKMVKFLLSTSIADQTKYQVAFIQAVNEMGDIEKQIARKAAVLWLREKKQFLQDQLKGIENTVFIFTE